MRPMRIAALILFGAAATLGSGRAARADITLPGTHRITGEVSIDFGPFAGFTTWRYEVKEGDTFASIAEKVLGDAKRVAVIAELNPGVDAAAPKAKTMLVLPPKATEAKGPRGVAWWDVLQQGGGGGGPVSLPAPFYFGEPPAHSTGSWNFYAVPHDRMAAVREGKGGLRKDPAVLPSDQVYFPSSAQDSDPTKKIVTKYRFGLLGDKKLAVEIVEQKRYDAKGVLLSQAVGGEAPTPGTSISLVVLLVACFAAATALIAGVAWRRRSRTVAGGAT